MWLVSISSCRPRGGCPSSAEGGFWLRTEPLRPFGAPPLSGEAFGAGGSMRHSVRVTFVAYASPKRQGVPAAVYGQPTECHGAEPKETPVVSPPGRLRSRRWLGAFMGSGGQPSLHGYFGWPPGGFAYFARVQSRSSVRRRTKRSLAGSPAQSCAARTISLAATF